MADDEIPKEFPDVSKKLAAPKQLSAYEKERQAAQAKEKRAEAENAAALKAFQESFADGNSEDDDPESSAGIKGSFPHGPPGARYAMPTGPRSGPGSLGPIGGPPPSMKRKRALEEMREAQRAREEEMREFDDPWDNAKDMQSAQSHHTVSREPDQEDYDVPRPMLQLSSLPPATSSDDIKQLLKDHVKVSAVRLTPSVSHGPKARYSLSAAVTLSTDTSTEQVNAAVSALKQRYLGCGFYLSISRHNAYANYHPSIASTRSSEPFGANAIQDMNGRSSMRNAPPPPTDQRRFAPPESYDSPRRVMSDNERSGASVDVHAPLTTAEVKAIHVLVDALLLQPDPQRALQMEAMLMSLPEVQKDERFAFLYDARSPAGVYYRFLLWYPEEANEEIREKKRRARAVERIHQDVDISWLPPHGEISFPDLHSLEQAVIDMDYVSSDEDSDDEGGQRQFNHGREGQVSGDANDKEYLSLLKRARLVHLLSRLPTSNARLRRGDIARITNFAITHAGSGAQEIVDLLLLNVDKPLSMSLAANYESSDHGDDDADVYEPDEELSNLDSATPLAHKESRREEDPSNARLIGLYVISDILSASSTAGARNAWKYRQLFESALIQQKTFERLGKLAIDYSWGKMKSDQWKRKIEAVFDIWKSWSAFSGDLLAQMKLDFAGQATGEEDKSEHATDSPSDGHKEQVEGSQPLKVKQLLPQDEVARLEQIRTTLIGKTSIGRAGSTPGSTGFSGSSGDHTDHTLLKLDSTPETNTGAGASNNSMSTDRPVGEADAAPDAQKPPSESVAVDGKPSAPRKRLRAEDMFADSDND